jgi:hypothetical protein
MYVCIRADTFFCGSVYFATGHEAVESKQPTKNRTDLIISYSDSDSDARLYVQILLLLTLRKCGVIPLFFPLAFVALC